MHNVAAEPGLRVRLIKYSEEVLSGEVIACEKHRWACQRFLYDIEREGTEDFPYIFEEDRGELFLDWMRLFKHRKGVLAGQYIEPHIIQEFNFGNIYGWVHEDTELRRFNKGYWQVGRKNAKSQSLGASGSYEASAFGEPSAEVYCAATKKDQSKIVWEEIEAMIMGNPDLRERFKVAYGTITHLKSGSIIKPLSKEDRKTGDGTNPSAFFIDEYHAHETMEIYDIGDSGMGARLQPLLMIITTAGFDLNKPCYRVEYQYVSRILDPNDPIENDNYFVMINELDKDDDIKNEENWPKANPILCSYENGIEYIRKQLKVALDVPEKMKNFLTKNMNIWVDAKEDGYMEMSKWKKCESEEIDLKQYPVWVGIDLSTTTDLSSVGLVFRLPDNKFAVRQHSFMPEDKLQERINSDRVPFDLWEKQEFLTTTPGSVVDYSYIEQYILNLRDEGYDIQEINYDKWNATHFAQMMEMQGFEMVEIPQMLRHLSGPTKDFRKFVYSNNIIHFNDPLLSWAVSNAIQKQDAQENIMLDKSKSRERIDPIAAVINAFSRSMSNESNDISNHFLNNWTM
ncbi:Phage terminase-like protein, large subunit, contains N-terminal HTH domain [Gracilibacillus orientalis]|uniref:Phage terminase-like protein, large subunit, contains N-terminal HTH domain n=1 Tax=Gracilibacillus orientalis TaxID=334253 RepID=A0A1I4HBH3_9BACI|nr:terminase TerL endonuclease subunit [Gracilibacillus orientalis]SFL39033.1 Phage terminase-like protein, large subunit, contains N-terminal HTH domain [Gracilibacillus orientalis]